MFLWKTVFYKTKTELCYFQQLFLKLQVEKPGMDSGGGALGKEPLPWAQQKRETRGKKKKKGEGKEGKSLFLL